MVYHRLAEHLRIELPILLRQVKYRLADQLAEAEIEVYGEGLSLPGGDPFGFVSSGTLADV